MGTKLVYDSSCRFTDKTLLMDEYELPSPDMPKIHISKIPVGILNRVFSNIEWACSINRTRFRELNTFLENLDDFKVYAEIYDEGILVIRVEYKVSSKRKSYSWSFFKKY